MGRYEADQFEGRPETDPLDRMWVVRDTLTGGIVASWRETPNAGLTEQEAVETAAAWNRLAGV